MNDRQILLIKYSWSYILPQAQQTGQRFYVKLFELSPALQPMFRNDPELQARKFIAMMTLLVRRLQHARDLTYELEALSRRHVRYGTQATDYAPVGLALFWTLSQTLGDRWTGEIQSAWRELYTAISNAMVTATRQPG
ncbi:globin domain-containing protein [Larkinella terrae]|uniref:Hemin receptor n=1 Tax=Larkinella terrae TaxID=2025311 RepID=A0A7K0EN85_9BACT|nr:globin domain-containing protein [Larkinella terrae]MRS63192.1 hemin receptor [Larkinella terrae]